MKVCPKCARSFAEALRYCPQDATELVKYDLRADLNRLGEFRFLIPTESLIARLRREFSEAFYEFKHNPKSFAAGLLRGEANSRRRKRMLHAGVASALMAYSVVMMTGALIGLFTASPQLSEASEQIEHGQSEIPVFVVPVFKTESAKAKLANQNSGKLGGSFNRKQDPGGGGGAHGNQPSRSGVPTQAALNNQLLPPNLDPPKVNPTLVVPMTVVADPNAFLKMPGRIGDWRSSANTNSLGDRGGKGIGQGEGDGYSDGNDLNVGGRNPRFGGSKPSGIGNDVQTMTRDLRPTITFRPRAKYTELARLNKIQGSVVLSVIYGADGLLRDIRVQHGLPDGLTEEAIAAARQISFNPATREGRPVSVRGNIEYNFALY
ncbi:MAG: energy transducer TonB [Acidobacteriota bacterium]